MNDIDLLMQRVDEINAKDPPYTAEDISVIIAYHRNARARKAAGIKPERPKVDLEAILGALPKPKSTIVNPFKGKL